MVLYPLKIITGQVYSHSDRGILSVSHSLRSPRVACGATRSNSWPRIGFPRLVKRNNEISISQQDLKLDLELVSSGAGNPVFRLAFHSSRERLLLPYPEVTGLQFMDEGGELVDQWRAGYLVIAPGDEFVLREGDRIAFDLTVPLDSQPTSEQIWSLKLPSGRLKVRYVYEVNADKERYDFLAKRSRFAAITQFWGGRVESTVVDFER